MGITYDAGISTRQQYPGGGYDTFSLGLFWLSAIHRQLDNIQQITGEEQRYLRAYNQAESSLNWGVSQRWALRIPWRVGSAWHCMAHQELGLKACVKRSSLAGFFILKGESLPLGSLPPLMLYQRVKLKAVTGSSGNYQLIDTPHGWLDFALIRMHSFASINNQTRLWTNYFSGDRRFQPTSPAWIQLTGSFDCRIIFSISLLGLLQYHQALLQGFASSWQQRQAWSWLHQYMESQSGTDPEERWAPEVKPGWHYRQFIDRIEGIAGNLALS